MGAAGFGAGAGADPAPGAGSGWGAEAPGWASGLGAAGETAGATSRSHSARTAATNAVRAWIRPCRTADARSLMSRAPKRSLLVRADRSRWGFTGQRVLRAPAPPIGEGPATREMRLSRSARHPLCVAAWNSRLRLSAADRATDAFVCVSEPPPPGPAIETPPAALVAPDWLEVAAEPAA